MTFNNTTPANFFDVQSNARASSSPFVDIFQSRDPTTSDITTATAINNYATQQKWLNTSTNTLWELKNYTTSNGVLSANWVKIGSGIFTAESLTGNTGGPVFPDVNHNINTLGDGTYITVVGNPATNTLTIEPAGGLTTLYTENTGTATPMAGNLNVFGSAGIVTTGSGNTITISPSSGNLFLGNTVDAHTAPGTNPVVPNGSGLITVTGGQVAAGTTANVIRTDSLAANTFTIEVQRSQAVASTTIGDNGVCHFNSDQFTVDSNGFVSAKIGGAFQLKNQVFTTSGTYTPTTGMVYCQITCIGGGGGGGGAASTMAGQVSVGGGGGGGEYSVGIFSAATIGSSQTVTIGAAGAGGAGVDGTNGGTSSVGALISSFGGGGGVASTANSGTQAGLEGGGGTGGTGGDYRCRGSNGLPGLATTTGAFSMSGQGASSQIGEGGGSVIVDLSHSGTGNSAGNYGSGGGGAANGSSQSSATGGNGTAGIIVIQEYIFT